MGVDSGDQTQSFDWQKWTAIIAVFVAVVSAAAACVSANSSRASADVSARALEVDRADLYYDVLLADSIPVTGAVQLVLRNPGKRPVSVNGVRVTHGEQEALVTLVDLTSPVKSAELERNGAEGVGLGRVSPIPAHTVELSPGGVDFLVISADVLGRIVTGHRWCRGLDEVGFELITGIGFVAMTPPGPLVEYLQGWCGNQ